MMKASTNDLIDLEAPQNPIAREAGNPARSRLSAGPEPTTQKLALKRFADKLEPSVGRAPWSAPDAPVQPLNQSLASIATAQYTELPSPSVSPKSAFICVHPRPKLSSPPLGPPKSRDLGGRPPVLTQSYTLEAIASIRPQVDHFFDKVLVNAPDESVRSNRLKLLGSLLVEFSTIADFSEIVTQ